MGIKKQQTVALSIAKVEYILPSLATSQAIWLRRILEDIPEKQDEVAKFFLTTNQLHTWQRIQFIIVEQDT